MAGLARPLLPHHRWWPAAVAAGTLPLALAWCVQSPLHRYVVAGLVFLMLLTAVRERDPVRGILGVAVAFFAHAALAISLAWQAPEPTAHVLTDGPGYWEAQLAWITTGTDPEYDWVNWAPHHLQLLVGSVILGVASFGLIPLLQGVYEVDLMNFYVGRLVDNSVHPLPALLLGWHPWSVLRGLCYLFLVYELSSLALGWFTQRELSTVRGRVGRLVAAGGFFLLDAVVKFLLLDPVRQGLAQNLQG